MDSGISRKARRQCLMRSSMLNAVYNTRGLQNIGFLYAMLPGLREIYPDDEAFNQSCARYAQHFNCHVFWGPFLCGAFLNAEKQIAKGAISPDFVDMFKETTLNSLSAVGDSFISGSLMVTVLLIMCCLAILASPLALLVFALFWLLLAVCLKIVTFYLGLARGFHFLQHIRRFNLINKGDHLKLFNGILLAAFLALSLQFPPLEQAGAPNLMMALMGWFIPVGVVVVLGYAVMRIHLSRTLAIIAMVIGTSIFI